MVDVEDEEALCRLVLVAEVQWARWMRYPDRVECSCDTIPGLGWTLHWRELDRCRYSQLGTGDADHRAVRGEEKRSHFQESSIDLKLEARGFCDLQQMEEVLGMGTGFLKNNSPHLCCTIQASCSAVTAVAQSSGTTECPRFELEEV